MTSGPVGLGKGGEVLGRIDDLVAMTALAEKGAGGGVAQTVMPLPLSAMLPSVGSWSLGVARLRVTSPQG